VADSQLVQISIASLEAKELSQFTPNESLAQRGEEMHCCHSTGWQQLWARRVGIPASWSDSTADVAGNHMRRCLSSISRAMQRIGPQSQREVFHSPQ